jgi:selenide, water dikinase
VNPNVLVDASSRDDAAVYRLSDTRALIATVDFFTPIVDNAADWGAIAAANALSDVYAMGGQPLFALNLVAWPRTTLPYELLGEVLAGASEIATEAGCLMLGGHSVDDPEPKFGMCVIGEAHPDRLLTNANGEAGDLLVLTKPLGTGILATALKRGVIDEAAMGPSVRSMRTLNAGAMRAALAHEVRAATDVTGFGLLGHLGNILAASGVGARIDFGALPILEGALDLARQGIIPGGSSRNLEAANEVGWAPHLSPAEKMVAVDAQTSGGLLLAVKPSRVASLLADLRAEKTPAAAVIGQLTSDQGRVQVE